MNDELEVNYETSKKILQEVIQSFIEKQEEMKINDKELQTIFDSIKMKLDISSWTTTHPFDPFRDSSIQAIVESLQSREFDKPMSVAVAYRKLLYNIITYAKNEVLDDVNQSMKVAVRLLKMQSKYLNEITIWSLKVMQKMDEEIENDEKRKERIFNLSEYNYELNAKLEKIKFMQEQLEHAIDNLRTINTEIRTIMNPEILKPEIVENSSPTKEEKEMGENIKEFSKVAKEAKFDKQKEESSEPKKEERKKYDEKKTWDSLLGK